MSLSRHEMYNKWQSVSTVLKFTNMTFHEYNVRYYFTAEIWFFAKCWRTFQVILYTPLLPAADTWISNFAIRFRHDYHCWYQRISQLIWIFSRPLEKLYARPWWWVALFDPHEFSSHEYHILISRISSFIVLFQGRRENSSTRCSGESTRTSHRNQSSTSSQRTTTTKFTMVDSLFSHDSTTS